MGVSKKPRKKHRPVFVTNPLGARNHWLMEGGLHAALLSLESKQFSRDHLVDLIAHADLVKRLSKPDTFVRTQAESMLRMCKAAWERESAAIMPNEEIAIRAACHVTIPFMQSVSNPDIARVSLASLREHDKYGGIRI